MEAVINEAIEKLRPSGYVLGHNNDRALARSPAELEIPSYKQSSAEYRRPI